MEDDGYRIANVEGNEVKWDPDQIRKISEHPCYSEKASHSFGRAHLPVAPHCNIQCNYCIRKFDCVNESRPGVTSEILTPDRAMQLVENILSQYHYIKVIGIAGPGEPLANEETFETFNRVHEKYPHLILCVSSNGLLLPESIDRLEQAGVTNITVTMNALDPEVAAKIYSYIDYGGRRIYAGKEMGKILIDQQKKGILLAVQKRMLIKVNTVFIPGINEDEIVAIAKWAGESGVFTHNIIPLIAQAKFASITPPTMEEKLAKQKECEPYIKQMSHCQRCRADAIGCLGKDIQSCLGSCSSQK
ncbi:MAG: radical SAM protein [Methanospirillaceae archaeon]|nr:radical SAM protein [Methanospirillaceae archaeon]